MLSRWTRAGAVGAMAVAAVAVVSGLGAPGGAQTDPPTSIVQPGTDTNPVVSDDGRIVVFVSTPLAPSPEPISLVLHDRGPIGADGALGAPTTVVLPGTQDAIQPSVSGDGCTVTWSVPAPVGVPVDDPADDVIEPLQTLGAELFALDRCAEPASTPQVVVSADAGMTFGTAATSTDGGVVAVSSGDVIVRFERSVLDGSYVETHRFDGPGATTAQRRTGQRVDVSDSGSVVVFAAGTDPMAIETMTVFAHEVIEGVATSKPVLAAASQPSMSGDASTIAVVTDLGVSVVGRGDTLFAAVDLGPGVLPAVSGDGNHVVIEGSGVLSVVSRTGQGAEPFATRQTTTLSSTGAPTTSGPAIDRLGTTIVSDAPPAVDAVTAETDIAVSSIAAEAGFDAELFDLGVGDVGEILTTSVTFSNQGPASVGVASLTVDGTFRTTNDRCGAIIRPGTTCTVGVAYDVERLQDAFGVVTLEQTGFAKVPFTTEVTALGEAPFVEPPTTVTTTTVSGTTGGSTSSTGGTGSSSTSGGGRPTSTTGGSTTGGATAATTTTTTTTTTVAPGAGVSASPASFDFAPTIIDAGRRTGLVEIVNNGTRAVAVVGVRLEPADAGPFAIVETTCAGESIAAGARCGVTLAFTPVDTGAQSAQLIASLEGGTDITVAVTGTAAPAPVLAVIPGVASVGQVVTLRGSGFPTGVTIELLWGSTAQDVLIDDAGIFNVPVVVMANTQRGPADVSVTGQVDVFGDVIATMLVTDTSDRSRPSVLDGVGPSIGR